MNAYISAVNQKKAFAELLLGQAVQAGDQHHLCQALLQGAVMQLEFAYRFYLRELADAFQCKNARDIADLWTLIAHLQLLGKNPAETREIYNLKEDPQSWLIELQECWRAIAQPPEVAVTPEGGDRIAAVSIPRRHDWSRLSTDQVAGWLRAFTELVERHREALVEF